MSDYSFSTIYFDARKANFATPCPPVDSHYISRIYIDMCKDSSNYTDVCRVSVVLHMYAFQFTPLPTYDISIKSA